jgi:RNA recognition motif-containing protein
MTVLAFLATGVALAQTKVESVTKEKSAQGTSKTKTKTVTGAVKEYESGKKIKISGPGDKTYSFDLDENARIEGNIEVGRTAKVEYTKDNNGKERVTVLSEAAAAAEPSRSAAQSAETRASHSGGTMHVESTTKNKGPGPNTKVKTETVIGSVKEYEAGKKITVTGPKDKDYTFDLDENVAMKGSINVGERVKVSYTRSDGGDKVTTVVAYPAASARKKTKKTAA